MSLRKIKKDFLEAMRTPKKKTSAYDTPATVRRIDGDTVWVHIDGGVDETPVKRTIDARVGDTVQVRVGGGKAWLTGNQTAPPTDDTKAVEADNKAKKADLVAQLAKKTADKAGKTATNYLSWTSEYGLIVSEDATEDVTEMQGGNTRITNDGMEVYKGQDRVAHFGENTVIGEDGQSRVLIYPDSIEMANPYDIDMFNIDMGGDEKNFAMSYFEQADVSEYEGQPYSHDFNISFTSGWEDGTNLTLYFYSEKADGSGVVGNFFRIQKGTSSSGVDVSTSYSYDGENLITVTRTISTDEAKWELKGRIYVTSNTPVMTFGTRGPGEKGAFSATFGESLIASEEGQVVVGKNGGGDDDAQFIVANGSNIFTVKKEGSVYAKGEVYSGLGSLALGVCIVPAILTSSGSELRFTIPTGRVFPDGTTVTSLVFRMNARVGNSNGGGIYCVKGTSGGTDAAYFNYGVGSTGFYNANNDDKTVTQSMWAVSIAGNTNINVCISGGSNYFFTGTSTINGYTNNQPVVLYLSIMSVGLS